MIGTSAKDKTGPVGQVIKTDEIEVGSEFMTDVGLQNLTAKLCESGAVVVVVRSGVRKHTLPVTVLRRPAVINQDMKCFDAGSTAAAETKTSRK